MRGFPNAYESAVKRAPTGRRFGLLYEGGQTVLVLYKVQYQPLIVSHKCKLIRQSRSISGKNIIMLKLIPLVCLVGTALGQYWGHHDGPHDTPEVEHAKAKHFAAHAEALARLHGHGHGHSWGGDHESSSWDHHEPAHHESHWEEPHHKWTGPFAYSPGHDKYGAPLPVHDTHEVEAEKAKHFSLYAHGAYAGAYAHGHSQPSHGQWDY
ncbi:Hypothetical protein NTJ_09748 [Nesidiocoris tenuis]|uniref:Uncharacterized protein n=1 Tax=Nesidiocoris tenuis TaxID=355587 RepID=A0ABN7AZF1_9HEMI|nr:Hypothetical protein NTJ_09748 [Nesidiocoris tenuis]